MNIPSCYENWLESYVIDDEAVSRAYESLGNRGRAVLKKAIARLYRVWGESSGQKRQRIAYRDGFGLQEDSLPAPFALFACERSYASPVAMLAALLPALLAGVETVLPCFLPSGGKVTEDGVFAPLLAALELAGVERGFAPPETTVAEMLTDMAMRCGQGRLVILGGNDFAGSLALCAHKAGLPCRSLTRPLHYYNSGQEMLAEQRFTNNGESLVMETPEGDETVVYLNLDAAHEDIWFWPDLGPDWFRVRRMHLYAL